MNSMPYRRCPFPFCSNVSDAEALSTNKLPSDMLAIFPLPGRGSRLIIVNFPPISYKYIFPSKAEGANTYTLLDSTLHTV